VLFDRRGDRVTQQFEAIRDGHPGFIARSLNTEHQQLTGRSVRQT
jgi:hypothetical protein